MYDLPLLFFCDYEFEFQDYVSSGCHNLTMLSVNISNIAIVTPKNVDFHLYCS